MPPKRPSLKIKRKAEDEVPGEAGTPNQTRMIIEIDPNEVIEQPEGAVVWCCDEPPPPIQPANLPAIK